MKHLITISEDQLVTLLQQAILFKAFVDEVEQEPATGPDLFGVFLDMLGVSDVPLRDELREQWHIGFSDDMDPDGQRLFVRQSLDLTREFRPRPPSE